MPRPKTKNELLELSQKNYSRLIELIDSFPDEELNEEFPEGYLNRNIRDVLAHLHHWHLLFLEWYKIGMKGTKPDMPAKGYTWKTLPDFNREIWKKYNGIAFEEAKKMLDESFHSVQNLIMKHSNEDLFEKKKYKWTGSTSLAAYLISTTSSHYDWAFNLIKKCKRIVRKSIL